MFYLPELEQGILRMFSNQALFFIGYSTQHSNSEAEKILRRLPAQIVDHRLRFLFAPFHHRPPRRPSLGRPRRLVSLPSQGAWKRLSTTIGHLRPP